MPSFVMGLEELLLKALGEEETKKFLVHILENYAEKTDNDIDDDIVRGVAAALHIDYPLN